MGKMFQFCPSLSKLPLCFSVDINSAKYVGASRRSSIVLTEFIYSEPSTTGSCTDLETKQLLLIDVMTTTKENLRYFSSICLSCQLGLNPLQGIV